PGRPDAQRFAEQLAAQAKNGEDFAKLAVYDNGDSSYRHGEGYGKRRGEIKPTEAEAILFRMQPDQVGPAIEIPTGFHVIRLVKRDYAGLQPFDEKTQAEIRKKIENAVADREYKRLLNELKQKATIEIATNE